MGKNNEAYQCCFKDYGPRITVSNKHLGCAYYVQSMGK